jgi:hypothetical protein
MADDGARAAQRAQQAVGQHLVVFGNQDAHVWSPAGMCLFALLLPL